jgi:hypothetical protein
MGYYSLMIKLENKEKIEESDKWDFVKECLKIRQRVDVPVNSRIVREISDRIGSAWEDIPMPVAALDLVSLVDDFYEELVVTR